MGLTARLSISSLTHGSIPRPWSPSSTPSIRRSRCVSDCHVSSSPLTDSPFLSYPHVRLLRVGVPRTARAVLWKLTTAWRLVPCRARVRT